MCFIDLNIYFFTLNLKHMEYINKKSKGTRKTSLLKDAILNSIIFHHKKIVMLLFIMITYNSLSFVNGQVTTRFLKERSKIEDIIDNHYSDNQVSKKLVTPNIQATLHEDERLGKTIPRFAIEIATSFTKDDGVFYDNGNTINWKIAIYSQGATSLSIRFSNLNLPQYSQMFLYSKNQKMIMGPIVEKNIHDGIFSSDVIF